MKKSLNYLVYWLRLRLYNNIKFLRPHNFHIAGKLRLDLLSVIVFDRSSKINLGSNIRINSSVVHIKNAQVTVGADGCLTRGRITINDSSVHIGEGWRLTKVMFSVNNKSTFKAGKHHLLDSDPYFKSGLFVSNGKIDFGDNVNIHSHTICHDGVFSVGNNAFFNAGSQIRCADAITFGDNIFVSYECLIFDSNTHSVDAAQRKQEITDGYPNETIQTKKSKLQVKTFPIHIGNDVWIGTRAIIFKGTRIGNEVIVGAGAVLSGVVVADYKKVYGNPGVIKN
jgi:acetyltransferase-like isoleucine patch superfamily enzyme